MKRIILIAVAAVVMAAACGDSEAPADPGDALGSGAAGACLVGDPNCNDTPGLGTDAPGLDEEPDPGSGDGSSGLIVDGALTVTEAQLTGGLLAVRGYIVADGTEILLCEGLAESRPPQCAGASLIVSDLSTVDPDALTSEQGITWTDQPVTILGEVLDLHLLVQP